MSVISTSDHPLAEKDHNWDGNAAEKSIRAWAGGSDPKKVDWGKYRQCFMYVDTANKEVFGSYKFPYCEVISGSPHVVFRACAAIIGSVNGGRGGTSISSSDKKGIYEQAAKQYKRFDEDPPKYEG